MRSEIYDFSLVSLNLIISGRYTYLVDRFPPDEGEKAAILESFRDKCAARGITPMIDSISNPDVSARARSEWDTLRQEIGEVPDFDECFAKVDALYRSLPWDIA